MNLLNVADRLTAIDHYDVILTKKRYLHSSYRFSDCEACFAICPVNAIRPGKPPSLNSKQCQNCIACLVVCPVGAFAADDAVASLLHAVAHLESSTLELLCERNPQAICGTTDTGTGISIKGCLAGLGFGVYLALTAFGMEHILVRTDACSKCEWSTLKNQIEAQVMQAKKFLAAWEKSEMIDCVSKLDSPKERPLWQASNPPLTRRDLFRMIARQGQVAIARSIEEGQSQSGRNPGRDRQRILGLVSHLPAPQSVENLDLGELGFTSLSVTGDCTACGACARACPTRAIELVKDIDATTFVLKVATGKCIGCEICVNVCVTSAIRVLHKPTFDQVFNEGMLTLQEGILVKCKGCGIMMAALPGVQFCQLCEKKQSKTNLSRFHQN